MRWILAAIGAYAFCVVPTVADDVTGKLRTRIETGEIARSGDCPDRQFMECLAIFEELKLAEEAKSDWPLGNPSALAWLREQIATGEIAKSGDCPDSYIMECFALFEELKLAVERFRLGAATANSSDAALISALDRLYFEASRRCRIGDGLSPEEANASCKVRDDVLAPALDEAGACFDKSEREWTVCGVTTAGEVEHATQAVAADIPALTGKPYIAARAELFAAGWHASASERDCGGHSDICAAYAETESCSGTGMGFCAFRFVGAAGETLRIVTTGESVQELVVHHASPVVE